MAVSQEVSTPKIHTQLFASRILSPSQNIKYVCYIVIRISTIVSGIIIIIIILLFLLTVNGFLPGGNGTTIRHNKQVIHIAQNNTPRSNKTQHTKLHRQ
jgi:hypothetical protein